MWESWQCGVGWWKISLLSVRNRFRVRGERQKEGELHFVPPVSAPSSDWCAASTRHWTVRGDWLEVKTLDQWETLSQLRSDGTAESIHGKQEKRNDLSNNGAGKKMMTNEEFYIFNLFFFYIYVRPYWKTPIDMKLLEFSDNIESSKLHVSHSKQKENWTGQSNQKQQMAKLYP